MSKELVFQSVESLQQVVNVINERLRQLLNDKTRTIKRESNPRSVSWSIGSRYVGG